MSTVDLLAEIQALQEDRSALVVAGGKLINSLSSLLVKKPDVLDPAFYTNLTNLMDEFSEVSKRTLGRPVMRKAEPVPMCRKSKDLIKDVLENHLPRIKEGLERDYIDENQALVVYDHMLRARIVQELQIR